jgi:prepilin-type N-terminal cleavage/methylation domain-containing protein
MKLTNTQTMNRKSGMTLLELTVVILVLLSLISILFVGARAWKKGSDRSANIMNLRNAQQAMRGYQNMIPSPPADPTTIPFTTTELADYIKLPVAPNTDITYTPGATVTAVGTLWLGPNAAGDEGGAYGPAIGATSDW